MKARPLEEVSVLAESVGYHRLNVDLAELFKHLHVEFWARSILMPLVAALVCCLGVAFSALLTHNNKMGTWRDDFDILAVGAFASALAVFGIYPVLRPRRELSKQ